MTPQEIMADFLQSKLAWRGYTSHRITRDPAWRDDVLMIDVEGKQVALTHQNCTGAESLADRVGDFLQDFPIKPDSRMASR